MPLDDKIMSVLRNKKPTSNRYRFEVGLEGS